MKASIIGSAMLIGISACASPNIYGTPRTLGRGKVQHAMALEGVGALSSHDRGYLPMLPTYNLRIGLADRVDLGLRVTNLTGLSISTLVALRRARIDLALAPSLQGAWAPRTGGRPGWMSGQLPLLAGFNLTPHWTVLATGGVGFGQALGTSATSPPTAEHSPEAAAASAGGLYLRAGLGVQARLTPHFALQPEVTMLAVPGRQRVLFFTGLGFVFGAMAPH